MIFPMVDSMLNILEGFDPLSGSGADFAAVGSVFEDATKRVIHNILRSYTGYFDLFSEAIQNALDAVEMAQKQRGGEYQPTLWITIDIPASRFRIADNGVGMNLEQFKYCFRPNVSFKKGANVRGEKGVGATFLAYGFSFISLQSKKDGGNLSAILRQGRQWAEDERGVIPRPKFEPQQFSVPELQNEVCGTCLEIITGNAIGERPKDFAWLQAQSAEQWYHVLRLKTPLGGVYLTTGTFSPKVYLTVISSEQTKTEVVTERAEYYYPHEIPNLKVQSLGELIAAQNKIQGDASTKLKNLGPEFKRLDCLYEVWNKDALLAEDSDFRTIDDERVGEIIERHRVAVYAAFLSTAKTWRWFNDEVLKLRKGQRIVYGGLQLASDNMVQGDLSVIPLTSAIGYQNNAHIIVHFSEGSPDMGRKVFQPELKRAAELIAIRAVTIFRRFLQYLRSDTGVQVITPDREFYDWVRNQEKFRDENPLSLELNGRRLSLISNPRQEQDVVALFHELIGAGILKGFRFFGTSLSDRYDSLFLMDYQRADTVFFQSNGDRLGIDREFPLGQTEPKTLEYKFSFDGLIADFEKEEKFVKHINLLVCWTAGNDYKQRFFLQPLLVGDEGSTRHIYGATHKAYSDSSNIPAFEVIVLEDLLSWLQDPPTEEARQKQLYSQR